ncbi:4'-phosphopantetheinyl transferase superfamily protein [Acidovorax sp. LjRoot66]|uniref:4'-phosphopantetheinyl transferase family protein n=1 Tax=Acidovorax sp. LjRoot66 TaxID=3342334 RepID=UPI003ECDB5DE
MTTTTPALQLLLAAQAPLAARAQQQNAPEWLTESETARLAGMQHPARRQEFIACRYALRHQLAMARGTTPDHWRLDAPEGRAPHLNAQHHGDEAAAATHLSLSHSGAWLACAAAPHPVGIDLEVKDLHASRRDVLALAGMACTPGELAQLQALDDGPARQRHFLQIWSLKEAYFKCTGTGVDFAAIRRIESQPAGLPIQGQVLAHARAWHGATAGGHAVLLSVCALGAGGLSPCSLAVDADVAWQDEGDWRLVALPG